MQPEIIKDPKERLRSAQNYFSCGIPDKSEIGRAIRALSYLFIRGDKDGGIPPNDDRDEVYTRILEVITRSFPTLSADERAAFERDAFHCAHWKREKEGTPAVSSSLLQVHRPTATSKATTEAPAKSGMKAPLDKLSEELLARLIDSTEEYMNQTGRTPTAETLRRLAGCRKEKACLFLRKLASDEDWVMNNSDSLPKAVPVPPIARTTSTSSLEIEHSYSTRQKQGTIPEVPPVGDLGGSASREPQERYRVPEQEYREPEQRYRVPESEENYLGSGFAKEECQHHIPTRQEWQKRFPQADWEQEGRPAQIKVWDMLLSGSLSQRSAIYILAVKQVKPDLNDEQLIELVKQYTEETIGLFRPANRCFKCNRRVKFVYADSSRSKSTMVEPTSEARRDDVFDPTFHTKHKC